MYVRGVTTHTGGGMGQTQALVERRAGGRAHTQALVEGGIHTGPSVWGGGRAHTHRP